MTDLYNCTKPGHLFVGYHKERRKILDGFKNGNSYAVIGGRRCGKTSLLVRVEKDLLENGLAPFYSIPRYFSMEERGGKPTAASLFETIYGLAVRDVANAPKWKSHESGNPYDTFRKNLDRASGALTEKYGQDWLVILLIDEMDAAVRLLPDDQFFQNMRHFLTMSEHHRHFRLVATGVKDMAGLISSGSSPLNNLRNCSLRILTEAEAAELVRKGVSNIDEETLGSLFDMTGRHPYVLQGVLENLTANSTAWDIHAAAGDFLDEHKDFQRWADGFNDAEKTVYNILAKREKEMRFSEIRDKIETPFRKNVQSAVAVLRYHGIVEAISGNQFKIAGTLFRDWYLENYSIEQSQPEDKQGNIEVRVYISAVKEDEKMAEKIYDDLKSEDIAPWLDCRDLLPGQNKETAIRQAIEQSMYFLALLSGNSVSKGGYAKKELKIAMGLLEERSETDIFVIPVRLDECKPHDEKLRALHSVDLFESYENGLRQIFRVLKMRLETGARSMKNAKRPVVPDRT